MKPLRLLAVSFLIVLLVGCQKPIHAYNKAVEEILLPSTLVQIKIQCVELTTEIDAYILEDKSTLTDDLTDKVVKFKDLVAQTKSKSEKLDRPDDEVTKAHQYLTDTLAIYLDIVNNVENLLIVTKALNEMNFLVEEVNDQILEIVLSGTPTSLEYNQSLSDFSKSYKDKLQLFDLVAAEQFLKAKNLDVTTIQKGLEASRQASSELKGIGTFSDTDVQVNNLLIQMYEQIMSMYEYALKNKDIIEWTNQFESFSDYASDQVQTADNYLVLWEKNTGIVLE